MEDWMQLYMLDTNTAGYIIKGELVVVREHLLKVPMASVFSKSAIGEKKYNQNQIIPISCKKVSMSCQKIFQSGGQSL